MLTIHGIPGSRAFRCIWAAEEGGLDYRLNPVTYGADCKTAEFRALNPAGKIPALTDGDLVLTESLAINLHLAGKAGPPLMPGGASGAHVLQWTLWAATELEPPVMRWAYHTVFHPPEQRRPEEAAAGAEALRRPLALLEQHLAARDWILPEGFTLADLNVAAVLQDAWGRGLTYPEFPHVARWYEASFARPAARRVLAMRA
ncbi:glutathione S-transferase family protein [Roseomonas sp. GC11]|uniref:glutathione S-transferase family protein n=1 Tax=Roseomonas sp. GC11 TaxID=2950546 RepID=UPI00210B7E74|nr:glutathione S-transferase family protein [Roseomonas sp. GC11]MCQ4158840.1 glutathione S-transferase family protein [Roseomonas sp. GC11]